MTYSAIVTLSIITVLHTVYRDAVKELATYTTPMDWTFALLLLVLPLLLLLLLLLLLR